MNDAHNLPHVLPHVAAALHAFAAELARRQVLGATARLQTTVRGRCALEPLRQLEAAFDASWPADARPAHELIWAVQGLDDARSVSLCAYDRLGGLLLDRSFAVPEPANEPA